MSNVLQTFLCSCGQEDAPVTAASFAARLSTLLSVFPKAAIHRIVPFLDNAEQYEGFVFGNKIADAHTIVLFV